MKSYLALAVLGLIAIIGVACSSNPEPAAEPTAVPTATATVTPQPTSTPAPSPTPTPPPAPPDSDQLLESVSTAMTNVSSFHIEGFLSIKTDADADDEIIGITLEGDSEPDGDLQLLMSLRFSASGFSGSFDIETREVDGVTYTKNPLTDEWEIDASGTSFTSGFGIDSATTGDFEVENAVVEFVLLDGEPTYKITGAQPDEPDLQDVSLSVWVGVEDNLVRKIALEGSTPATDFGDFLPTSPTGNIEDLYLIGEFSFSRFNQPLNIEAPIVALAPTPAPSTPRPTATRVGAGQSSGIILTLEDLPNGFEPVFPDDLGLAPGTQISDDLAIEESFAFVNIIPFQFVFGFIIPLTDPFKKVGFDVALGNPDFLLNSLIGGVISEGGNVTEQSSIPDLNDIGETSSGLTVVFEAESAVFKVDVVAFRKGDVGAFVAIMFFEGDSPSVSVREAAMRLSDKITE